MAKIEVTLTDAQKDEVSRAAAAAGLKPATWARAQLILAARRKGES